MLGGMSLQEAFERKFHPNKHTPTVKPLRQRLGNNNSEPRDGDVEGDWSPS
jgi:hypothetical protein